MLSAPVVLPFSAFRPTAVLSPPVVLAMHFRRAPCCRAEGVGTQRVEPSAELLVPSALACQRALADRRVAARRWCWRPALHGRTPSCWWQWCWRPARLWPDRRIVGAGGVGQQASAPMPSCGCRWCCRSTHRRRLPCSGRRWCWESARPWPRAELVLAVVLLSQRVPARPPCCCRRWCWGAARSGPVPSCRVPVVLAPARPAERRVEAGRSVGVQRALADRRIVEAGGVCIQRVSPNAELLAVVLARSANSPNAELELPVVLPSSALPADRRVVAAGGVGVQRTPPTPSC